VGLVRTRRYVLATWVAAAASVTISGTACHSSHGGVDAGADSSVLTEAERRQPRSLTFDPRFVRPIRDAIRRSFHMSSGRWRDV